MADKLVCANPANLKGVSFDKLPLLRLPCNPKDNFNPYKRTFGLTSDENNEKASSTSVLLAVVVVCLATLTASALVYTVFYVRRHQNRYRSMQNVHYRVTPQGGGMTFENAIYRDNPTTIPQSTIE